MSVKVSPKFQVVIPEQVRERLGIRAGSQMEVIALGRIAYLVPVEELGDLQEALSEKVHSKGLRDKRDRKL